MGGVERCEFPVRGAGVSMAGDTAGHDDREKAGRFRALALPHLDAVYTVARYLLRNDADAEDAAQETYLRAYRYFDSFRGPAIKPWLFAILRNVCRAAHARGQELALDDPDAFVGERSDTTPLWGEEEQTPEHWMVRRADTESIRRLVQALPPAFREVIVLREINDLAYRDIAEVVGVPIGTVMSRLARARNMLRHAWIAAERGTS
jgi:RNA polymerase sigma-70 factor, ECF subfamily